MPPMTVAVNLMLLLTHGTLHQCSLVLARHSLQLAMCLLMPAPADMMMSC